MDLKKYLGTKFHSVSLILYKGFGINILASEIFRVKKLSVLLRFCNPSKDRSFSIRMIRLRWNLGHEI